jgi:threonyl-tRNA synthetase
MEKAHKAVDAVVDGVKKLPIGNEKKPKAKKEKGGDGGAGGPLGRSSLSQFYHHANKFGL